MTWRIESIAAHPGAVDTLAAWHHDEWGELMAPWSLDDARRELREHVEAGSGYPATLLALGDDDQVLGSVSLIPTDAPELPEYTPWLASLYVAPSARGAGIGKALVHAIVEHAHRLGFERLYLFTPGSPRIYLRCGWRVTAGLRLGNRPVLLMVHGPSEER
jgi:predicted N-acetyltransferase YhbS